MRHPVHCCRWVQQNRPSQGEPPATARGRVCALAIDGRLRRARGVGCQQAETSIGANALLPASSKSCKRKEVPPVLGDQNVGRSCGSGAEGARCLPLETLCKLLISPTSSHWQACMRPRRFAAVFRDHARLTHQGTRRLCTSHRLNVNQRVKIVRKTFGPSPE